MSLQARCQMRHVKDSWQRAGFLRFGNRVSETVGKLLASDTTGEYELKGKSRGASTAKRTIGGAAVGSIIGAIAGGGKGAGIGAAVGGGAGAGSEIITKGDQVKIPSETLLDFTLQQDVAIPKQRT
jgi:hypothetical protein